MNRAILRSVSRSSKCINISQRYLSSNVRYGTKVGRGTFGTKVMLGAGLGLGAMLATVRASDDFTISNDADGEKVESEKTSVVSADAKKTEKAVETKAETAASGEKIETSTAESEKAADGEEPAPQSAYNPETGEINWDCPCLGGMAYGPCGEEFKEAFACFIYSETEPRGIDCIKKFETMRSCFKRYPEHYKEELYEDGDDAAELSLDEEKPATDSQPASQPTALTEEPTASQPEVETSKE